VKTKEEILIKLKSLKDRYKQEGFDIVGVFGSYARDEAKNSSDIDILYKIPNMKEYLQRYSGWESVNHIVEIKDRLSKELDEKIDFVDIETLSSIGKKYILKDVIYV
jgi:predicted nucleotidyltransferase